MATKKRDQNLVKSEHCSVNKPAHYTQGKIEIIDFIKDSSTKEEFEGFLINNVKKYICRFRHKNGVEDLKKASWYLNRVIKELECED